MSNERIEHRNIPFYQARNEAIKKLDSMRKAEKVLKHVDEIAVPVELQVWEPIFEVEPIKDFLKVENRRGAIERAKINFTFLEMVADSPAVVHFLDYGIALQVSKKVKTLSGEYKLVIASGLNNTHFAGLAIQNVGGPRWGKYETVPREKLDVSWVEQYWEKPTGIDWLDYRYAYEMVHNLAGKTRENLLKDLIKRI